MKFEKNIKKLETFRLKVENLKSKENTKIENLLKWRENLIKKSKVSSKLINFNEVKGWHSDSNGNIHHKSGQFFSLQGVRTKEQQVARYKLGISPYYHKNMEVFWPF